MDIIKKIFSFFIQKNLHEDIFDASGFYAQNGEFK
jgi:hypothetical protein